MNGSGVVRCLRSCPEAQYKSSGEQRSLSQEEPRENTIVSVVLGVTLCIFPLTRRLFFTCQLPNVLAVPTATRSDATLPELSAGEPLATSLWSVGLTFNRHSQRSQEFIPWFLPCRLSLWILHRVRVTCLHVVRKLWRRRSDLQCSRSYQLVSESFSKFHLIVMNLTFLVVFLCPCLLAARMVASSSTVNVSTRVLRPTTAIRTVSKPIASFNYIGSPIFIITALQCVACTTLDENARTCRMTLSAGTAVTACQNDFGLSGGACFKPCPVRTYLSSSTSSDRLSHRDD